MATDSFTGSYTLHVNTMQFRGYVFPTNPEKISVGETRNIVRHFCSGNTEISQDLGKKARIVTCSGSFWGDSFSDAMRELLRFREQSEGNPCGGSNPSVGGVGMLYIPGMPPFPARLAELAFDAQGDGRIIPYTMKFIEAAGE